MRRALAIAPVTLRVVMYSLIALLVVPVQQPIAAINSGMVVSYEHGASGAPSSVHITSPFAMVAETEQCADSDRWRGERDLLIMTNAVNITAIDAPGMTCTMLHPNVPDITCRAASTLPGISLTATLAERECSASGRMHFFALHQRTVATCDGYEKTEISRWSQSLLCGQP